MKRSEFGYPILIATLALALTACAGPVVQDLEQELAAMYEQHPDLVRYRKVTLTADLSGLSEGQRKIVGLLIEASKEMDALFWEQAYGSKQELMESIDDPGLRTYAGINYGPWDRLRENEPFLEGVGAKPLGANFYPADMTRDEFESAVAAASDGGEALRGQYAMVRRDDDGALAAVTYGEMFAEHLARAAAKLREAAALAEDPAFARYLELRADALLSDEYRESDLAWMDMKDNRLDVVIGPIENYEDRLFGYKSAFEAYVLIKDMEWSERLARYTAFLPDLQRALPVPDAYKTETPGSDSDLNAYDVVYYAGDCNAGSKTIAINLPNDEQVQLQKGTRRLQLKNAMRAKFDEILVPISRSLIAEDQRAHVTFDAFFANTMFHEVAHGLGITNTITGKGTVRAALRDTMSALEEGKADVLGLYMITSLHERGELGDAGLEDNYVTFLGSIFRSIRFGTASAHGTANLVRFNFFKEAGAFSRDENTGAYRVDFERMRQAMTALSEKILRLQGDGDYAAARAFLETYAVVDDELRAALERLQTKGIPVDIVFEQGSDVLGLR